MERSTIPFKDKNKYHSRVILAMLSERVAREAPLVDLVYLWSFLQKPEDIVAVLKKRADVVAWANAYPDKIDMSDDLIETLRQMEKNRQIEGFRYAGLAVDIAKIPDGFVFAKETPEMKMVFMDVRYALEAMAALKKFTETHVD